MTQELLVALINETIHALQFGTPISKGMVLILLKAWPDLYQNAVAREGVARQSKPLVQRQSGIHPMVEQRSVGKLVSSPKPPEAGAQRARLYTSLTAGHHNSRMQLTLDDIHRRQ